MKKHLSGLFILLLLALYAIGQDRTVTGTVTSGDDGQPLPGVSVIVKGTNIGTQTDADGKFALRVPAGNNTLTFSYIGYTTQDAAISATNIVNVALVSSAKQLGEVVVTALGIERRRNVLPFSAQQITGEDVSRTRSSNFISGLSGRVSGMEIRQSNTMGGSVNVVLRGNKSFTGSNQALFVIDGVPIDNTISNDANQRTGRGGYDYGNPVADINPDDIASITVLKGAAASALYGSRGYNGVVLITTKKGTKNLGITVTSGITASSIDKSTFIKYQKEYGAGYGAYYESPDGYFLYRDINGDGQEDLVAPVSEDASYGARFDPNLLVYQWDAFDPNSSNFGKPTPWVAAANGPESFYENTISYNNSILITGGADNATFKLGYTRSDENGVLPNSKIGKNSVNFGSTYNITPKLIADASINFTRTKGQGRFGTGYDDKNLNTNFRQWWQTNVDIKAQKDAYFRHRQNVTWNWHDPTDLSPIYWDNPYFTRFENFESDERNRYIGNVSLNYKFRDWLTVQGRVTLDSYNELQEERQAVTSVTPSSYRRFDRNLREYNYNLLLSFNKDITRSLAFKGLLGSNIRRSVYQEVDAITNGGLVVPRIYSLANSLNPIAAPFERLEERQVDGYFAGATFTYDEALTLDVTARRDQSSTLPKGNNIYYYPSASLSFLFSKYVNQPWLSNGKVRVNWAEVGNDAPIHRLKDIYTTALPFGSTTLFSVPSVKFNPELKPERVKSYEAGLELGLFSDRLGFDITYYEAKSFDQIFNVAVSTATGYSSIFVNAGNVENKGWELALNANPVRTNDFSWNMNINWARNRNKVTELFGESQNLVLATFQGGISINATVGQPFGTIRGSDFVYTNGQKTVNSRGYYISSPTSDIVIGNANPDWTGGINNNLRYKDISLNFLIDGRKGGDVFSLDQYYGRATGLYPETVFNNDLGNPVRNSLANGGGVILPGVKADGSPNDIRAAASNFGLLGYARNPASAFVYDASFIKLREVTLTYSLPAKVISRMGPVRGANLSLVGRNLWIIHKNLPYADPEEIISAGNAQGYQGGSYPTVRNIGFNVKLTF